MAGLNWQNWLERLYNLRRDKRGSHERPHKPVLLLSIIDLLDLGVITGNAVPLSEELVRVFKRYFEAVRSGNDQPTIQNPFFHLCGDGFWQLVPKAGQPPLYVPGSVAGAPSVAELRRRVAHGVFAKELWALLSDPMARHQLREALIARYFPERREALAVIAGTHHTRSDAEQELNEELPPGRDAAFRRTILEIYDYRCAACGIRVILDRAISLVVAAHIVPFGVSRDDRPNNGMALCPNHHWAMDRHLIAPCPDVRKRAGIWKVNHERLDERIDGQRDLVALRGQAVIPPSETKFYPSMESLRWREEHLTTAY